MKDLTVSFETIPPNTLFLKAVDGDITYETPWSSREFGENGKLSF